MKYLSISTLLLFCFFIGLQAQDEMMDQASPEVEESLMMMSLGSKNSLSILLQSDDTKMIEKEWEKSLKSYKGKTKKNRKTDEIFTDNATMRAVSNNDVDIYARCLNKGENTEFVMWMDLGGVYLNSADHPDAYQQAEAMLLQFEIQVRKVMVQRELDEQEKLLKNFEKDLSKLIKDKESAEKDILDYQAKIAEKEMEIEQNLIEQGTKGQEIENQQKHVQSIMNRLNSLNF